MQLGLEMFIRELMKTVRHIVKYLMVLPSHSKSQPQCVLNPQQPQQMIAHALSHVNSFFCEFIEALVHGLIAFAIEQEP